MYRTEQRHLHGVLFDANADAENKA